MSAAVKQQRDGIGDWRIVLIICAATWGVLTLVETALKTIKLGTNFAVFLLFFGVAALEAFQTHNWIKAAFWLAIGVVFLVTDNLRKVR